MTQIRTCRKCKKDKELDYFYTNKAMKDGMAPWCIACSTDRLKQYSQDHPEVVAENLKKLADRNEASKNRATMNRQPWTFAEEELLKECWPTETADDIAEVLGRTLYAVKQRAKQLNIRNTKRHPADK